MGTVFTFSQSEGLLPLGEAYNPITYVTGIPATSEYEAIVLTPEQALKVLDELQQPEYTMIVLLAVTGIRSSEMLGLRWCDILWDRSEMKIRQTFVHGKIQLGAKTKLSKSTVTLHPILAQLLKDWRAEIHTRATTITCSRPARLRARRHGTGPLWLKTTCDLPLSEQACLRWGTARST